LRLHDCTEQFSSVHFRRCLHTFSYKWMVAYNVDILSVIFNVLIWCISNMG